MQVLLRATICGAGLLVVSSSSSFSSDLPLKARPPTAAPAWSWTGFYGGINAGYGIASDPFSQSYVGNVNNNSIVAQTSGHNSTITRTGGFVGAQGGYNYQVETIVLGVEADWQWADQSARSCGMQCGFSQTPDNIGIFLFGASSGTSFPVDQRINWFGTARARIGWTPFGNTMLYATGGAAWMGISETDAVTRTVPIAGIDSRTTASFNNTASGYAVGGGAEFHLWGNWMAKAEYLHIDVGGVRNTAIHATPFIGPLTLTTTTGNIKNDLVRLGLNYKFDQLTSSNTLAASSFTTKANAVQASADRSWTGFYVGANGGYGVASDSFLQTITRPVPVVAFSTVNHMNAPKGGLLGAQGGYNYQTGALVLGIEGDVQWSDQRASSCGITCISTTPVPGLDPTASSLYVEQKIKWFSTVRGRVGWTPFAGTMLYATAGGAWMGLDETDTQTSLVPGGIFSKTSVSFSNTVSGYAVGGGAELQLWNNWTAKVEYLHLDVGGTTNTAAQNVTFSDTTATSRIKNDLVRIGLNYRLGDLASGSR